MKLSEKETDLFFEVMWPLLHYACKKLRVIPEVDSMEDLMELDFPRKISIRDAVFDNPKVIDEFIADNPAELDQKRLFIAKGWRGFIKGSFHIERYLKKYAIFIHKEDVYAVHGLRNSLDEIVPKSHLPMYVKAILLPFRDRIVYDGFLKPYNIVFGRGITGNLKEIYLRAKQNDRIIFSLEAGDEGKKSGQEVLQTVDWSRELRQLTAISGSLRGGRGQPVINSAFFSLIRASVDLASSALIEHANADALFKGLNRVEKATGKVEDILHRME